MKIRYAALGLVLGTGLGLVGGFFKIMHYAGADWLQLAGLGLGLAAMVLLCVKLARG